MGVGDNMLTAENLMIIFFFFLFYIKRRNTSYIEICLIVSLLIILFKACAVMALERVPADIRKDGGVARMSDPKVYFLFIYKYHSS